MVNSMCQLDWPWNAQIKTLFLYVSVRVFPNEVSISVCEGDKADHPSQGGSASLTVEGPNRTEGGGRRNSTEMSHLISCLKLGFFWYQFPWISGLWTQTESPRCAYNTLWDFPDSILV